MRYIGLQALMTLISHIAFIVLAFQALRAVNFEKYLKVNLVFQSRLLIVFLSIVIGFTVSSFFLNFIDQSRNLLFLFN